MLIARVAQLSPALSPLFLPPTPPPLLSRSLALTLGPFLEPFFGREIVFRELSSSYIQYGARICISISSAVCMYTYVRAS